MKLLLVFAMVGNLVLATVGPIAAETVNVLNQDGIDHFNKGFYEATPRGEHAVAAQEYSLAERSLLEAIHTNPNWVEPYLHLGRVYFTQQKYQEAAEVYQKALRIVPQNEKIHLQLASALEMAGDYHGAVQVLEDLRVHETDGRSIAKLDELIKRLQARAQGGSQP